MLSFSPKRDAGATDEAELIKVYFPKFTVTSNNNKIKKDKGENSIADFKEQVLTKKECVNLMFHTLKTYRLNEGIDAIKEVTELLDKQNIKCK